MRRSRLIASAAALVAVLAAAGCGTGGIGSQKTADPAKGKQIFTAKCAACHTLADASAIGTAGPSLDDAFAEVRKQGFAESTIFEVVNKQIEFPTERDLADPKRDIHVNGPLPTVQMDPNIVTGQEREDVAAYIASVAGKPVQGGDATGGVASTDGKEIFASAGCVACHTLKDAGASGQVGPNLDQAKPAKALVVDRVTSGQGAMPSFKGKLNDAQIQAVADYVSSAAGK